MNELFLCTPGSIGSIVCLRQSPTMGALPPTPRSFPHWANGLFAKSVAARGKPCRNTEVSAPLATSTAPVALRQSRILRTMPDSYLKSPQHQSLRAQSCRNPVLLRLRCLVLNRLCLVLLRPRHHDVLMARVARRVQDQRLLSLIRRYLASGIMSEGLVTPRSGPLSPLLSNILLDDLDRELEKRGHLFCRYADDCNVYVGSQAAGQRVLESLTTFLRETLKLTVNLKKSAVDRPWKRKFLGFSFTSQQASRVRVAPQSVVRFKDQLRQKFREGRGRNLKAFLTELQPKLRGWSSYFSVAETRTVFEDLDQWIRRKLRCMEWRKWKRPRTRWQRLITLGLDRERARSSAFNGRGPWWNAGASHLNAALPTSYFRKLGLISLMEEVNWYTLKRSLRSS